MDTPGEPLPWGDFVCFQIPGQHQGVPTRPSAEEDNRIRLLGQDSEDARGGHDRSLRLPSVRSKKLLEPLEQGRGGPIRILAHRKRTLKSLQGARLQHEFPKLFRHVYAEDRIGNSEFIEALWAARQHQNDILKVVAERVVAVASAFKRLKFSGKKVSGINDLDRYAAWQIHSPCVPNSFAIPRVREPEDVLSIGYHVEDDAVPTKSASNGLAHRFGETAGANFLDQGIVLASCLDADHHVCVNGATAFWCLRIGDE